MAFVFLRLISLSTIPLRSIRVVANGRIAFFSMAEYYSTVRACGGGGGGDREREGKRQGEGERVNVFTHSSINRHSGCYHALAIVHNSSMDTRGRS